MPITATAAGQGEEGDHDKLHTLARADPFRWRRHPNPEGSARSSHPVAACPHATGRNRGGLARLIDFLPTDRHPDAVLDGFLTWAAGEGFTLYPAQEEAVLEVIAGPTSS